MIQQQLPEIFEHLGRMFRNTTGRMSAHQIEERVKKVFCAWKEWSIFPLTYLAGLETMFYLTEADVSELQRKIQEIQQENRAEDNLFDDEFEQLKKKAKNYGIYCAALRREEMGEDDEDWEDEEGGVRHEEEGGSKNFEMSSLRIVAELKAKLVLVERFLSRKYGMTGDVNTSSLIGLATTIDEGDDAIDEEMARNREAGGEVTSEEEQPQMEVTVDDVDGIPVDDVDGVPLLEEDVDGIPLDDVDGVPLGPEEEDDIDGVPLTD